MSIEVGVMCIVVRTCHPEYMGKICTCICNSSGKPFGSHVFEFQNGLQACGEPRNVRPITPPPTSIDTRRPKVIEAA